MRVAALTTSLIAAVVLLSACEDRSRVGSEGLTDFEEQKQQQRLGEVLESPAPPEGPASSPNALGASPTAPPKTGGGGGSSPPPQGQVFEVSLIAESPYYQPGQSMKVSVGTTMRITNRGTKSRHPYNPEGQFDWGDIAPGASVTYVADTRGTFEIRDNSVPFATATLEVS